MKRFSEILGLCASLLAFGCSRAEQPPRSTDSVRLSAVMQRDLDKYFSGRGVPVRVEYAYLRNGATVTGIADPKYYLWIAAKDANGVVTREGAARVAEIDSTIAVTHFLPREYIKSAPGSIDSIFPASVAGEIRKRL
jgi:hypothetical protein